MITSCAGTSITISRRLIFTMRSTPGMIQLMPASFTPAEAAEAEHDAALVLLEHAHAREEQRPATIADQDDRRRATSHPSTLTRSVRRAPHAQLEPVDAEHLDALVGRDRLGRARAPVLAAHEHGALGRERASSPRPTMPSSSPTPAVCGRASVRPTAKTTSAPNSAERDHRGHQHRPEVDVEVGQLGPVEEHRAAEQEARDARGEEHAVGADEHLGAPAARARRTSSSSPSHENGRICIAISARSRHARADDAGQRSGPAG